jgi:hypothetical protein
VSDLGDILNAHDILIYMMYILNLIYNFKCNDIKEIRRYELFIKTSNHGGRGIFVSYINNIGSKIDESDLIYISCTLKYHVQQIYSLNPRIRCILPWLFHCYWLL